jgi:uncharacterized protein (DUF697 family)
VAAAIIPVVLAAAPLLQPLITSLVTHVEHLFGAKTGPTKFDVVLNAVTKAAEDLSAAGKLPGVLDSQSITAMIQTVVADLQAAGVLNPTSAGQIVTATSNPQMLNALGSQSLKIIGGTLTIGPSQ